MLNIDNSQLLIIDIQDKLVNATNAQICAEKTGIILKVANILNIPVTITEQYPKGLGETVDAIKNNFNSNTAKFEKTSFSVFAQDNINRNIESSKRKQVLICGIETHICVLQSAQELIEEGFDVYLLKDCSASRHKSDYDDAIQYMQHIGVKVVNTEIAIFQWLKSSKHPNFKEIQALIK